MLTVVFSNSMFNEKRRGKNHINYVFLTCDINCPVFMKVRISIRFVWRIIPTVPTELIKTKKIFFDQKKLKELWYAKFSMNQATFLLCKVTNAIRKKYSLKF